MADESGPGGVAKGLRKSLDGQMWTGHAWVRVGDLLADWLIDQLADMEIPTSAFAPVRARLIALLATGPTADQAATLPALQPPTLEETP
jgi:hypothetical protein